MDELRRGTTGRARGAGPGAMTRVMRAARQASGAGRCLRVAVVRDGSIESERVCRSRDAVTVGRHERATVPVADPGAPLRQTLFDRVGDGYVLELTDGMRARIARAEGVTHLTGPATLILDDCSRGKIDVGAASVLFQMVDPPPATPRPRLPATVRGGFVAGIDWLFSAVSLASFLAFFGFVLFLEGADWPVAQAAEVPDSLARFIVDEPPPPPPDVPERRATDARDPQRDEPTPPTTDGPSTPTADGRRAHASRPTTGNASLADRDEIRQAAMLSLGTLLGDGSGTALDRLRDGAPTTDAAALLAEVDGVARADADTGAMGPRDACAGGGAACGSGRSGTVGSLRAGDGHRGPVDEGTVDEREITTIVEIDHDPPPPRDPGGFDPRLVTEQVRRKVRAIRACYEHTLGPTGDLEGRVTAELTVQRAGNVSDVRALDNSTGSPAVARCVVDSLRTIRLREGPDFPMTFSYPFVFAARQ